MSLSSQLSVSIHLSGWESPVSCERSWRFWVRCRNILLDPMVLAQKVCHFKCIWKAEYIASQNYRTIFSIINIQLYPSVHSGWVIDDFCWIVCGSTHELQHYLTEKEISQSQKISCSGILQIHNSKNSTVERLVNSFSGKSPPPTIRRLDIQCNTIKNGIRGWDNNWVCLSL